MSETNWRTFNRANWDERVKIHLAAESHDLSPLRSGRGKLTPIEEAEIGPLAGLRVLHLQCHFGRDSLTLAQRGATVVGLDFSGPAIAAARALATELGLTDRARFIEADLYDAPQAVSESFDLVFVNWGAVNWLPDIRRWAEIVADFLNPGGALYLADGHPCALVFDDEKRMPDGMPGYYLPYFVGQPIRFALFGILFKLWQRGIHLIPRVRVRCPHIHLRIEPTRITQTRSSDRGKLRNCVGLDHNWRAAFRAKAAPGLAARLTGRGMEAE